MKIVIPAQLFTMVMRIGAVSYLVHLYDNRFGVSLAVVVAIEMTIAEFRR